MDSVSQGEGRHCHQYGNVKILVTDTCCQKPDADKVNQLGGGCWGGRCPSGSRVQEAGY